MPSRQTKTGDDHNDKAHAIEWVLGALSAAIILGLAGFLVFEGVTRTGSEPLLSLRVVRVVEQANGYGVVVEVRNQGHATAADVEIAGIQDGAPLVRQVTLDYAPAESTREITLVFAGPVAADELQLVVLGYIDP